MTKDERDHADRMLLNAKAFIEMHERWKALYALIYGEGGYGTKSWIHGPDVWSNLVTFDLPPACASNLSTRALEKHVKESLEKQIPMLIIDYYTQTKDCVERAVKVERTRNTLAAREAMKDRPAEETRT